MSIALERGEGIGGPGGVRTIPCIPACESPAAIGASTAGSRSSSIGRNSDCSSAGGAGGEEGGEAEVQSSYKGPLETMDALEESLPIRRGISKFYCGKSKSFAILSDAMNKLASAKELGKPENAYSRKRKKLLSLTRWETADCDRSSGFGDGAAKRHANSSGRIAGVPVAAAATLSLSGGSGEGRDEIRLLPPPNTSKNASPWASYLLETESLSFPVRSSSLMDLAGMESLSSSSSSLSSIGSDEQKGLS